MHAGTALCRSTLTAALKLCTWVSMLSNLAEQQACQSAPHLFFQRYSPVKGTMFGIMYRQTSIP